MPFMCCARAQPQARGCRSGSCGRCQRTDVRCQTAPSLTTGQRSSPPHPTAIFRSSRPGTAVRAPPRRCSRIGRAYPCPGPTSPRGAMAGPASRSRLASRCHKS